MVDFRFDIRPLFPQPIVKVTSNLLPHTFRGDRRQALDATSKMSEIIDRLGQLSAASQKLTIPITTGQRLRQSENQKIYILADTEVEPRGVAIGLLKVGKKDLYLFDETGQTRKVEQSPCILDFYIHESRQRTGLGKELFETMLVEENWKPVKCSIDRPSEKLIAFMRKYYGLERTIPQANNFVLFEGYFDDLNSKQNLRQPNGLYITNSPNTQLFGATHLGENNRRQRTRQPDIITQVTQVAPAGRYGARRPVCSMAQKNASSTSLQTTSTASAQLTKSSQQSNDQSKCRIRSFATHNPLEQRRSGLQEVDEDFFRQNLFARPLFRNNLNSQDTEKEAAISEPVKQLEKQTEIEGFNRSRILGGTVESSKQRQQQQENDEQEDLKNSNIQDSFQDKQNTSPPLPIPQQQQQQQQKKQENALQISQLKAAAKKIQLYLPVVGKTEMCTTCPNCRATIYLIIHQVGGSEKQESSSHSLAFADRVDAVDDNDDLTSLTSNFQQLQAQQEQKTIESSNTVNTATNPTNHEADSNTSVMGDDVLDDNGTEEIAAEKENENRNNLINVPDVILKTPDSTNSNNMKKPSSFNLSKQHTGMKNISFGVGMAVTPSNKMEFDQEEREDFGIVKINRPIGKLKSPTVPGSSQDADGNADAMSTISSTGEGLTEQGYYDLKFYHNKLW